MPPAAAPGLRGVPAGLQCRDGAEDQLLGARQPAGPLAGLLGVGRSRPPPPPPIKAFALNGVLI